MYSTFPLFRILDKRLKFIFRKISFLRNLSTNKTSEYFCKILTNKNLKYCFGNEYISIAL